MKGGENLKKTFSIPATDIDVKEIENGDFLQLKIYAISTKTNRNKSEFLEESFEDGIKTIYNKPILAYFNKSMNDTEEHNSKVSLDENGELFYDYDFILFSIIFQVHRRNFFCFLYFNKHISYLMHLLNLFINYKNILFESLYKKY